VLIPIFGSGVTAVGPALGYLSKIAKPVPSNVKTALGEAVLAASDGRDIEKRAIAVLEHQQRADWSS
jgi:hypothetical protein